MADISTDMVLDLDRTWYKRPLPLRTQAIRFIPILIIASFILAAALLVTNARMPNPEIVRPLPDIGFELIKKVAWLESFADVCIGILNVLSVFLVFKLYLLHRQSEGISELRLPFKIPFISQFICDIWDRGCVCEFEKRNVHLIAWIRFLTTYSIMLLFRSVVITLTSYPATDNQCQNPVEITEPVKNVILTVVTMGSGSIHCGDLMFSGHTIIITLNLMIQWTYGPMIHWIYRPLSVAVVFFSFYCIIASRSHYTDDVVVAFYSTVVTFMTLRHSQDGAPWQLQLIIRGWPCCGSNASPTELDHQTVVVLCEEPSFHQGEEVRVKVDTEGGGKSNNNNNNNNNNNTNGVEENLKENYAFREGQGDLSITREDTIREKRNNKFS